MPKSEVTPQPPVSAAARRAFPGLSRVLRAQGRQPHDHRRSAHRGGLRVHLDADQHPARRAADARGGRLRPVGADVPARGSTPSTRPTGSETPEEFRGQMQLIYELLDTLRIPHLSKAGFEADDLIATLATRASAAGHERADRHRRPRRAPAGRRARHGPDDPPRHQRHDPVHARGRRGEIRPDPGAVPRLRRAARRPQRQPAQHPQRRARRPPPSGCASSAR